MNRALIRYAMQVTVADIERVLGICLNHRLRKDVLDTIDSGTMVSIMWRRVMDPAMAEKERLRKKAEEDKAVAAAGSKGAKAGAWGGLPI